MAPAELEGIILEHSAVEDVAVVGVPDERAGELPQAHVVVKPGHTATTEDIYNHIKGANVSAFLYLCRKPNLYQASFFSNSF